MALPTTGIDAHGHRRTVEPREATVPAATITWVSDYQGQTYNSYIVQYLGRFWPDPEAAAHAIEGVSCWGAHWATNPAADGTRKLTVYSD